MGRIPAQRSIESQSVYRADAGDAQKDIACLRELRVLVGKAQVDIASFLNIKQPSVSKIEKQTDMYVSTLRSYVEAIGGELELTVRLPTRPLLRLHHIGKISSVGTTKPSIRQKRDSRSSVRCHG